jgi:hypothetical protein
MAKEMASSVSNDVTAGRMTVWGNSLVLAGLLAINAVGVAQPASASSEVSEHVYGGVLKAEFPARWHVLEHAALLSFESNSLVFASNEQLHFTCISTHSPAASSQFSNCQGPLAQLRPNGVLAEWDQIAVESPVNISTDTQLGRLLTIDGLPARLTITKSDTCNAALRLPASSPASFSEPGVMGSQETVSLALASQQPDDWFAFNACIRGPHLARVSGLSRG